MTEERNPLIDKIIKWCEANPYCFYGDYRDELSQDMIEHILDGEIDKFYEEWSEVEWSWQEYVDLSDMKKELAEFLEFESFDDMPDKLQDVFHENIQYDPSDLLRTCLNNSKPMVVATPLNEDGEPILFPHYENDEETNERLTVYLKDKLGIEDPYKAETTYSFDALKVCGQVDLEDFLKYGRKAKGIWIGPDTGGLVTHNSYNGSGGLGDIRPTKRAFFPCNLSYDEKNRYGVQAVFGFTNRFWENELELEYEMESALQAKG